MARSSSRKGELEPLALSASTWGVAEVTDGGRGEDPEQGLLRGALPLICCVNPWQVTASLGFSLLAC